MIIKIKKANIGIPLFVRTSFIFTTRSYGSHTAEITLTKDGDYSINVDGYGYSQHEGAAMRSVQYKTAISKVTDEMRRAIDSYNDAFAQIGKKTVRPIARSVIEEKLNKLKLKKYSRKNYSIPQPNKADVETDLREEANEKYFSVWSSNTSKKRQFISDNLETEFDRRMSNWNELRAYHESIQSLLEKQINETYQQDYYSKKKAIEDELYGDELYVEKRFNEIFSSLNSKLPYDITIEVNYNKTDGLIDAVASLPSLLLIPDKKAVTLASGKISIKDKLKREFDEDTLNSLLGLSYYLSGHLFSLSVNVNTVRLSVVTGFSAYYWVEYTRSSFSSLSFPNLSPTLDFFYHPNVIDLKRSKIELIADSDFQQRISDAIKVADALKGNNNLVAIALKEAERIYKAIVGADDLGRAIIEAKSNHSTIVIVDKRYKNVLNELENNEE